MADDISRRGPDDELQIDVNSPGDLSYWADKLNLTEEQLRGVIEKVGPRVLDVEMVIGKYTPTSNPR
ncbi:DUF3606 domain-containing protein [Verrucomicrobiota bacterium sgz303538]